MVTIFIGAKGLSNICRHLHNLVLALRCRLLGSIEPSIEATDFQGLYKACQTNPAYRGNPGDDR